MDILSYILAKKNSGGGSGSGDSSDVKAMIGDLNDLTTEAKDTLVNAINELAQTGGSNVRFLTVTVTETGETLSNNYEDVSQWIDNGCMVYVYLKNEVSNYTRIYALSQKVTTDSSEQIEFHWEYQTQYEDFILKSDNSYEISQGESTGELTDDSAMEVLYESGIIEPVTDTDGYLLTDNAGSVFTI